VTYTWNFGDGSPERVSGLSATVAYTYAAVGSYTATVTATNGVGQATASTQVTVTDAAITGLTARPQRTYGAGQRDCADGNNSVWDERDLHVGLRRRRASPASVGPVSPTPTRRLGSIQ
jgi:PKD repeat protein